MITTETRTATTTQTLTERLRVLARPAPDPASVTRLRGLGATAPRPPDRRVAREVVDAVDRVESMDSLCGRLGLTRDEVLDVVASLGRFAANTDRSLRDLDIEMVKARDVAQPALFQNPSGVARRQVVIPDGFERAGRGTNRRDVTRSLAALAVAQLSDADIARWADRQMAIFSGGGASRELASALWLVAADESVGGLGRVDELDEIQPDQPTFAARAVEVWDTLEVTRQDALHALCDLLDASSAEQVAASSSLVRVFVPDGVLRQLHRVAEHQPDELRNELDELAGDLAVVNLADSPQRLHRDQLAAVMDAAGLTSANVDRAATSEITDRLEALGLAADADQLVPAALSAQRAGEAALASFWEAMEARADGDPNWVDMLA